MEAVGGAGGRMGAAGAGRTGGFWGGGADDAGLTGGLAAGGLAAGLAGGGVGGFWGDVPPRINLPGLFLSFSAIMFSLNLALSCQYSVLSLLDTVY